MTNPRMDTSSTGMSTSVSRPVPVSEVFEMKPRTGGT